MTSSPSPEAELAELIRALGVLSERPGPSHSAVAQALGLEPPSPVDHTELFVHQLPPYASIYLDPEGKIGGDARDRVAGFWRAVGLTPPAEPDHLASLLGLWAGLVEREAGEEEAGAALVAHAARVLVWEHLASWLAPYLAAFVEVAPEPYRRWAELVSETVLAALPDELPPLPHGLDAEPVALDEDLVSFVLAPARSGLVLTRADLSRAARELGLGMRLGERAFALRSLLDQDRPRVVAWLAVEARRHAARLEASPFPAPLRDAWASRASRTARELA